MSFCIKFFILFLTVRSVLAGPLKVNLPNRESNDIKDSASKKDVSRVVDNDIADLDQEKDVDESNCSNSSEENGSEDASSPLRAIIPDYQSAMLSSLPYQGYPHVEPYGIGVSNYNDMLYPRVHRNIGSYNPMYSVNSLPPVMSTYIHGLIPQEDLQRTNYDMDVLNENVAFMPALVRPSRMLRSSEEEWMAQLQHDAIMSNIVPTMSVPFARYAAPAAAYRGGVTAVFPGAASGGCAQPILFSCTPKITRGTIQHVPVENYHAASATPVYREDSNNKPKSDKPPVKVNLTQKTATEIKGH